MTTEQIISFYESCESLKITASHFGVSLQKIRRILIDAGVYESECSRDIIRLFNAGFTPCEIGEKLNLSRSSVYAYLPYTKGQYRIDTPNKNTIRIRECRKRKETKIIDT